MTCLRRPQRGKDSIYRRPYQLGSKSSRRHWRTWASFVTARLSSAVNQLSLGAPPSPLIPHPRPAPTVLISLGDKAFRSCWTMELTCLGFCCRLLNPGWPFSEDSVLSFCLALVKQFYTELIIRLIKKKKSTSEWGSWLFKHTAFPHQFNEWLTLKPSMDLSNLTLILQLKNWFANCIYCPTLVGMGTKVLFSKNKL